MYSESLMNPLLQLLHMVWTRNKVKRTLLSSILVVVLLMYPCWQLIMVFSKSSPHLEILIWEEKTSIKDLPNISLRCSRRSTTKISRMTQDLCKNSRVKLKRQREIYLVFTRLKWPLKILWTVLILVKQSPEQDSKNFAMTYSRRLFNQYNKYLMTLAWRKQILMK